MVVSGVPQGSVLGPLLFNTRSMLRDIASQVNSKILQFADD